MSNKEYYFRGVIVIALLLFLTWVSSYDPIPKEVRQGYKLPDTLEMCQSVYVDANDKVYLLELEVKQLKEELKEKK